MRTLYTLVAFFASVAGAVESAAPGDSAAPGRAAATSEVLKSFPAASNSGAVAESYSGAAPPSVVTGTAQSLPDANAALGHLQGERSRLEAQKQLLTLQLDIATLHRKIAELESSPHSMSSGSGPAPLPMEPPPTVLSRRGFDGHFTAVLRMSAGGRLLVRAGDSLPNGKVEAVDSQGVTVTWYGRRQRLLDAEPEGANTAGSAHNLDLSLPAPPTVVTAH